MTFLYAGVLYLLCFRLSIVAASIVCIVLGYKLFCKGISSGDLNSTIEVAAVGTKLTIGNAAPGTAFALFGGGLLVVMMIQNAPSVILDLFAKSNVKVADASTPHSEPVIDSRPVKSDRQTLNSKVPTTPKGQEVNNPTPDAEQHLNVVMRGNVQSSISLLTAQGKEFERHGDRANAERSYREAVDSMAEPINDLAWLYLQSGRPKDALSLASIAVQLDPRESNYKDTEEKARKAAQ